MGVRLFLQEGRIPDQYQELVRLAPPKVACKIMGVKKLVIVDMLDAPDVPGGGTQALVGFGLEDTAGNPVEQQLLVELHAYCDVGCTEVPRDPTEVWFSDATIGQIIDGEGTSWIKVITDLNGEFACTLNCVPRETIVVASNSTPGGPILDCSERDQITFLA